MLSFAKIFNRACGINNVASSKCDKNVVIRKRTHKNFVSALLRISILYPLLPLFDRDQITLVVFLAQTFRPVDRKKVERLPGIITRRAEPSLCRCKLVKMGSRRYEGP